MLFARAGFFFGRCSRIDPTLAVKTDPVHRHILDHGAINISVVNDRVIHSPNRGVAEKPAALPSATAESGAEITETIVDSSVKAYVRPPITTVPTVAPTFKTPITWRPQKSGLLSEDPSTGNPIIIVITVRPTTRDPNIADPC